MIFGNDRQLNLYYHYVFLRELWGLKQSYHDRFDFLRYFSSGISYFLRALRLSQEILGQHGYSHSQTLELCWGLIPQNIGRHPSQLKPGVLPWRYGYNYWHTRQRRGGSGGCPSDIITVTLYSAVY